MSPRPTVFISYSHCDEGWKNRLVIHLKGLGRHIDFELWDDSRIPAGTDWAAAIERAISAADVAVLLISADSLASDFINDEEVPRLLGRGGLTIFPIIVKPSAWREIAWLRRLEVRPKSDRPLEESDLAAIAVEIADRLRSSGEHLARPGSALPPRIHRGLMPAADPRLYGRDPELERLDAAWSDNSTHLLTVLAWGGVGKSALVNHWLERMARDNYHGARNVFCWSFLDPGREAASSADDFIDFALRRFGDDDPTAGSPRDKSMRLVDKLRAERSLLVLDGLEYLQNPPGGVAAGQLRDRALAELVGQLAADNPGLCVLTSRYPVTDIQGYVGSTAPVLELGHLSSEAGAELLRALGVEGPQDELCRASDEVEGHSLTLNLLGTYLREVYRGDVGRRSQLKLSGRRTERMMASYEEWLGEGPELEILRLIGLFDGPADQAALRALRQPPVIPGLTEHLVSLDEQEWRRRLASLRRVRLLLAPESEDRDVVDAHSLVRAYFRQQLRGRPEVWQASNQRLFEHFQEAVAAPQPETLEEMAPLLAAVGHGCEAGRHQDVLSDVYWRRISRREDKFLRDNLGLPRTDLEILAKFLVAGRESSNEAVASLDRSSRAFVLINAGLVQRLLGDLEAAEAKLRAGIDLYASIPSFTRPRSREVNASRHLSQLYVAKGDLEQAQREAEKADALARRGTGLYEQVSARTTLANVLHFRGSLKEAEAKFQQAEKMREGRERSLLYRLPGYRYCDLLLDLERFELVADRTSRTRAWEADYLLGEALNYLARGRALMGLGDLEPAGRELDQAVYRLRRAGQIEPILVGHLVQATWFCLTADFEAAEELLDRAIELACESELRLHEIEGQLERCRLRLALGERVAASDSLAAAEALLARHPYPRCEAEVARLRQLLTSASGGPVGLGVVAAPPKPVAPRARAELDLGAVAQDVRRLVEARGELLISRWSSAAPMTRHDRRDFTTEVDVEVETVIKQQLRARFPDHGISGEETAAVNPASDYQWLIDPIDGTKYYAGQSSLFAVSVGLLLKDRPVLGVVYSPSSGQCFHAYEGGGAFLGAQRLGGPEVSALDEVIVSVDTPGSHALPAAEREWFEDRLLELTRRVYRIRALGIGSLAACWLASGAIDSYLDLTGYIKPQDLAAGRIIMQEAGARVETVDPGVGPPRLLAAPPKIWDELRRLLLVADCPASGSP